MKKSKSRNTRIAKKKFARKVSSKQKKSLVQKTSQNVVQFPKNHTEIQKINHALSVGAENKKDSGHKEGFLQFVGEELRDIVDELRDDKVAEVKVPPQFFDLMTQTAELLLEDVKEELLTSTTSQSAKENVAFLLSSIAQTIGSLFLIEIKDEIPTDSLNQLEQILGTHITSVFLKVLYKFEIPAPQLCLFDTETGEVTDMDGNAITGNAYAHNPITGELISTI